MAIFAAWSQFLGQLEELKVLSAYMFMDWSLAWLASIFVIAFVELGCFIWSIWVFWAEVESGGGVWGILSTYVFINWTKTQCIGWLFIKLDGWFSCILNLIFVSSKIVKSLFFFRWNCGCFTSLMVLIEFWGIKLLEMDDLVSLHGFFWVGLTNIMH